jgi:hypothetical protein
MSKIRAKAAEIKQKEQDRKDKSSSGFFLKVPVGLIELRVLPPWSDSGDLAKELYTYFKLPPGNTTCLDVEKSYPRLGLEDPVGEVITEFEDVLKVWNLRSKPTPKINVYLPDCETNHACEDLDKAQLGKVLICSPSVGVYNDIIKKITNPRIGDITDADSGYYITIEKTTGAKWQDTAYSVELIPAPCPIHEDADEQEKILSQRHDLDKLFMPPDDAKLSEIQQAAIALAKHLEKLAREQGHNVASAWASNSTSRKTRKPVVEDTVDEEDSESTPGEEDEDEDAVNEVAAKKAIKKTEESIKARKQKKQEADIPFQDEEVNEEPPKTKRKSSPAATNNAGRPVCFADSDVYKCDDEQVIACTRCMWEAPCVITQKKAGTFAFA